MARTITVDGLIEILQARKGILEANPRSLEILEKALAGATKLARIAAHRRRRGEYRIVLVHDQ